VQADAAPSDLKIDVETSGISGDADHQLVNKIVAQVFWDQASDTRRATDGRLRIRYRVGALREVLSLRHRPDPAASRIKIRPTWTRAVMSVILMQ
jgi:hypothetical protein